MKPTTRPTNEPANRWPVAGKLAFVALLAGIALWLGVALHPLAVDDAFITYRFAHNLATGNGFVYNTGHPVLSTTAPLFGLLLAVGSWLGLDLPSLANILSAVALWVGALFLFLLGQRENTPWVGALAALFYVLAPLLWLSLGLETAFFLALALGAIVAYRSGRLYGTAVLLALATMTRGDGLILTAVVAADYVLHSVARARSRPGGEASEEPGSPRSVAWIGAVSAAMVYVAVLFPWLIWLTWQFGSPLPATLQAKVAQGELGVTGFYAYTTYLQGLWILVRARLMQSLVYILFLPALLTGLVAMWRRAGWVLLVVAWGAAHLVGYTLLGVTPYYWYYAPLIPGLACASALGIVEGTRWLGERSKAPWQLVLRWGLAALWAMGLTIALVRSDLATAQALDGPVPPPENALSKVLPEAKVDVYEQAGRWLHDHTPALADVGVTEVGVMGHYSQRPMVDFLGLLEPEVAVALARGDLYWALVRYQPDYLVLTAVSPLYAYDLRADPWFQAAYAPVQTFEDPRFWGSPVTIYERQVPRTSLPEPSANGLPEGAMVLNVDFGRATRGEQIRLLGADTGDVTVRPGDVLGLTLYWEALGPVGHDYTVFVHLLGEYERVIAQRDAQPGLGARPTSQWVPGAEVVDPYLLALPEAAYAPDQAVWEVGLYDATTGRRLPASSGTDYVRFGQISVLPVDGPLHLDFGPAVLTGYTVDRLALSPGESLEMALQWEGAGPADVTVRLLSERGDVGAQASGDVSSKEYRLTPKADAAPGLYDLEVLATDPATGQPLPLLGADGQPKSDRALLTTIRLYP